MTWRAVQNTWMWRKKKGFKSNFRNSVQATSMSSQSLS